MRQGFKPLLLRGRGCLPGFKAAPRVVLPSRVQGPPPRVPPLVVTARDVNLKVRSSTGPAPPCGMWSLVVGGLGGPCPMGVSSWTALRVESPPPCSMDCVTSINLDVRGVGV